MHKQMTGSLVKTHWLGQRSEPFGLSCMCCPCCCNYFPICTRSIPQDTWTWLVVKANDRIKLRTENSVQLPSRFIKSLLLTTTWRHPVERRCTMLCCKLSRSGCTSLHLINPMCCVCYWECLICTSYRWGMQLQYEIVYYIPCYYNVRYFKHVPIKHHE